MHDKLRLHLKKPFDLCSVLDYGCGWGNVIRYFMKDVPLRNLHACDPHKGIIQVAKDLNPHLDIVSSDSLPTSLPFARNFDFIYALSIWTHLSPIASEVCLTALHASLNEGGIVYLTVRPPAYAFYDPISKLPGWNQREIAATVQRDGIFFIRRAMKSTAS
jgi:trans-aconitate methyltransferase